MVHKVRGIAVKCVEPQLDQVGTGFGRHRDVALRLCFTVNEDGYAQVGHDDLIGRSSLRICSSIAFFVASLASHSGRRSSPVSRPASFIAYLMPTGLPSRNSVL